MVDACTGVILEKPMLAVASSIHSERGGVSPSQALEDAAEDADSVLVLPLSGAIADVVVRPSESVSL